MGGVLNSVSKGTEGTEESKGEHFEGSGYSRSRTR